MSNPLDPWKTSAPSEKDGLPAYGHAMSRSRVGLMWGAYSTLLVFFSKWSQPLVDIISKYLKVQFTSYLSAKTLSLFLGGCSSGESFAVRKGFGLQ